MTRNTASASGSLTKKARSGSCISHPALARCDAGNGLATMPAINVKVRIGCEDGWIRQDFTHPYQASVGETHRDVAILLHEPNDVIDVMGHVEIAEKCLFLKQLGKGGHSECAKQIESLRQGGFTSRPNGREAYCLCGGPVVLGVALVQESNEKTAVSENA